MDSERSTAITGRPEAKETQASQFAERFDSEYSAMQEAVERLEVRLSPLMTKSNVSDAPEKDTESFVPFIAGLDTNLKNIMTCRFRLEDIVKRLEI